MSSKKQQTDQEKSDHILAIVKFQNTVIADVLELLDPCSRTPLADSHKARVKLQAALSYVQNAEVLP